MGWATGASFVLAAGMPGGHPGGPGGPHTSCPRVVSHQGVFPQKGERLQPQVDSRLRSDKLEEEEKTVRSQTGEDEASQEGEDVSSWSPVPRSLTLWPISGGGRGSEAQG